ncbi:hypothetical protein CORC01_08914 [Colletotrichum orchidophilum]|uniref:SHSP domain-containing protein n=1 Tax=Colletotrichum orchidophilum TaxID=1209926 RepID=A0A1G4B357_9PEZI|nr:uncharacterized protein CORC01_08914 [Colletotrichum orchidophilum]OHE95773.1 hypothetical protein CORC01_08914 [Colletotrichum orchidophilum]
MSWAGPNGNNNPWGRPGGPQGFWNFIHSLDPNMRAGVGVDHSAGPWANLPPGFAFHGAEHGFGGGGGGWGPYGGWGEFRGGFGGRRRGGGRFGSRGHHGRRGDMNEREGEDETTRNADETAEEAEFSDKEKDDSPDTMRDVGPNEDGPDEQAGHTHHHGPGRRGGRGGRAARFGGGSPGDDPWRHSRHGHRGHRGPPPPPPFGGPHPPPPPPPPYHNQPGNFDIANWQEWLNQFADHPFAQQVRDWATRFGGLNTGATAGTRDGVDLNNNDNNDVDSAFTPPVDIFSTERSYVLHFALPGAKKEDIGVNWDADKGELRVAGVVYRPGDEEFLATMASGERRIGMFSRSVPLPPRTRSSEREREREEIDALAITAKMEDGILVVTVPKVEKEWTEIHKVDIE